MIQYMSEPITSTAVILIPTYRCKKEGRSLLALTFKDAVWLGISQGLAIIPGISRSGITIASLLTRGVEPSAAFKFSFLAGIPAILGLFLWEAKAVGFAFEHPANFWLVFGMSFLFGLLGLFILKGLVKNLKLHYFGYYLVLAATLGFIFLK